ncbi:MAG: Maf family protein [Lachnospiraceae bacterium]|nr:Maf family protein [Lachnospiraceae bacterium]
MTSLKLPEVFILASASPRRKELIRLIGIDPKIEPSALKEDVQTSDPAELVRKLSAQKAADIASRHHDGEIVIGADTCVYLPPESVAGEILGKPHTHLEAEEMVRKLQGRTHEVYTGVTIIRCPTTVGQTDGDTATEGDTAGKEGVSADREDAGKASTYSFVEKTSVTVYPMTEEEITLYSLLEEPMDKAGAYAVQGVFSRFIKSLDGDYFNVMGLPLGRLYQELKATGGIEE